MELAAGENCIQQNIIVAPESFHADFFSLFDFLPAGLSPRSLASRRSPYELLRAIEKLNKNNGITKGLGLPRPDPAITFFPAVAR